MKKTYAGIKKTHYTKNNKTRYLRNCFKTLNFNNIKKLFKNI